MDLPDSEVIAAMTVDEFDTYWQALGVTVRVAAVVEHRPEDAQREVNNTAADTSRTWQPGHKAPASAKAEFGFSRPKLSPIAQVMTGYYG
jgi:hypothetical protein